MRRREEGWRTARSLTIDAAARPAVAGPQLEPAAPAAPVTRPQLVALGEHIRHLASRFSHVEWSLTFIGVLLYIFVTTTYRLPVGDVAMACALFGLFLLRGQLRFPPAVILYFAILIWACVGLMLSPYPTVVVEEIWNGVKVGLILVAMVNALRSRAQIRFFIVFFLACFGSHPARGTVINYLTGNADFGRAAWNYIYENSNDMAALTLLQLSMALGLVMTERKGLIRWGALFALGVFPIVILMTQSRAVMLGLGVFTLLAIAGHKRKLRSLAVLALVGGLTIAIAPKGVWDRMKGLTAATDTENLRAVDQEGSAEQRWMIWQAGAQIVQAHPIAGVGLGAYQYANGDVSAILGKRDAHSTYLTFAAENGYPGLLLFLGLVGVTIARARKVRKRSRAVLPNAAQQLRYLEIGLIGFLVAGVWGSYGKLAFLYVHIALIWAVAAAMEAELRRTHLAAASGITAPPAEA
ncbi:MAG TPA: O-antigen ligase family protein [Gemmatimonadales bacterium]